MIVVLRMIKSIKATQIYSNSTKNKVDNKICQKLVKPCRIHQPSQILPKSTQTHLKPTQTNSNQSYPKPS